MSDRQLMRAVRAACEELVSELADIGWDFDHDEPLLAPGVVTVDHLDHLQATVGPLPDLAVDFWLEVGGVDLSGEHPDWAEQPAAPFVLEAPLDDLLERLAAEAVGADRPLQMLAVSPDFALAVQDAAVIGAAPHPVPLVEHLRACLVDAAGLPGWAGEPPDELVELAARLPSF